VGLFPRFCGWPPKAQVLRASPIANKRVKIYERVQVHRGRSTDRAVAIPKLRFDGTLYPKDEREGKFRVSWHEGTKKQRSMTRFAFAVFGSRTFLGAPHEGGCR
jgi:hypothetical protein